MVVNRESIVIVLRVRFGVDVFCCIDNDFVSFFVVEII